VSCVTQGPLIGRVLTALWVHTKTLSDCFEVAWGQHRSPSTIFWQLHEPHTKTLATFPFFGQSPGPRQQHWHQFFGSPIGPHKDTSRISWAVAWANKGAPAPFFGQLPGPRQEHHQNQLVGSSVGANKDIGRTSLSGAWVHTGALAPFFRHSEDCCQASAMIPMKIHYPLYFVALILQQTQEAGYSSAKL
jgi:hypothetical protein